MIVPLPPGGLDCGERIKFAATGALAASGLREFFLALP